MTTPTNPDVPTVVVGVSETSGSPVALAWARDHAERIGGRVVAVRAYKPVAPTAARTPAASVTAHDEPSLQADAEQRLAEAVDAALGPDHGVELRAVRGGRRRVLVDASRGAELLVLDAPGTVTLAGDPISLRRLVDAAQCPVVVMPPSVAGADPSWLTRAGRAVGRGALRSLGTSGRPGLPPVPPS